MPNLTTETDIRVVRQAAVLLENHVQVLTKRLAEAHAKLAELTGQNDLQADLALVEALANAPERPAESAPKDERKNDEPQRGHGAAEQPNLPQEELICSVPGDSKCPKCGEKLSPAPGLAERSELIDVVEVKYVLKKVVREAAVCRCGECVVIAPGPERVTPGGRYSLDFGIKVALDKYLDHLPLARQARIMSRHGLEVTDQVLWDQVRCLGEELLPTWKAIRAHIIEGPVIGVDQTPWPNLEANARKPWQMWALTGADSVWHGIQDDKSLGSFAPSVRPPTRGDACLRHHLRNCSEATRASSSPT